MLKLEIDNVWKSFGENSVLKGVTFSATAGDIIGLVGKSGCGKSTLLKIIIGFHKPDKGAIRLNDASISKNLYELRLKVGYTTQENSFYEKLTVIENMRYYAKLYSLPTRQREERISHLLGKVNLLGAKNTLAENISGGMKRRLDFAISLIHNPSILILDEPTAGLDPLLIDQFWRIVLDTVEQEKKIVIMSSHILPEIEKYCTKSAVLHNGKVIQVLAKQGMKDIEKKFRKLVENV